MSNPFESRNRTLKAARLQTALELLGRNAGVDLSSPAGWDSLIVFAGKMDAEQWRSLAIQAGQRPPDERDEQRRTIRAVIAGLQAARDMAGRMAS